MSKAYDLAVKTGTYIKDGEEKNRYKNVGVILNGDDGMYILLDRTFNPAGVPNPKGSEKLIISMFTPRERDDDAPVSNAEQRRTEHNRRSMSDMPQSNQKSSFSDDLDDEIPF